MNQFSVSNSFHEEFFYMILNVDLFSSCLIVAASADQNQRRDYCTLCWREIVMSEKQRGSLALMYIVQSQISVGRRS
jgi:hypothetical protein